MMVENGNIFENKCIFTDAHLRNTPETGSEYKLMAVSHKRGLSNKRF